MDGTLLNWLKAVGDSVKKGEIIAEFEADKATVEVEAPADGVLVQLHGAVGDEMKEGTVIALVGESGEKPAPQAAAPQAAATPQAATTAPAGNGASVTEDGRIKASPLARKIAQEKGVDLQTLSGTGPGGRIVKSDVENVASSTAPRPVTPAAAPAASAPVPAALGGRTTYGKLPEGDDVEVLDINKMRQAIADATVLSKQYIPHFYVTVEIDVEPLLALRAQLNKSLEKEGVKLTVNDMIVKATALTLRQFPNLNTHYYGDKLVRHKRINIGISVALPNNGLLNVVAQDADKVALSELARRNKEMFERARAGKIKPEDIRGATFTISNLGAYDVEQFAAIIAAPEAGILAVSAARKVPIVLPDDTLGVGTRMKATISIDHRVSDGAEGAEFMRFFRTLLENPMRLVV